MFVRLLALTMFFSAFLMFWCQPMVAKMVLPLLGGSASVWTTCVLFFQTMLLGGYVYAHALGRLAALPAQMRMHAVLMLSSFFFLPLQFAADTGGMERPSAWLLLRLAAAAGVPLFVLSATAPLLQNWLSKTKHEFQRDPYFLYAASNAGSLLALVIYPVAVEPRLGVSGQSWLWAGGYSVLVLMVASAAVFVSKYASPEPALETNSGTPAIPAAVRLYWVAAAFVPSALMLAVTNHISVNLAPVPFLWIVPLATYLLTWVLAFANTARLRADRLTRLFPFVLLLLFPLVTTGIPAGRMTNWLLIGGHIVILFAGALLCHGMLAKRRPDASHLTEFYFWIALGGALGGVFAATLAPAIFATVFEYPLLVATLAFFRSTGEKERRGWRDWAYPSMFGVIVLGTWYAFRHLRIDVTENHLAAALADFAFIAMAFTFRRHRWRFALGLAVLLFSYSFILPEYIERGERLYVARNFFGVKKVLFDLDRNRRKLLHGDTLHGLESRDPLKSGQPISYYHPDGPVGDVFAALGEKPGQHVAVVGLGTGTMAAYAGANRRMTFFEIDPQVVSIARGFFTFTRRCAANCDVVVADGRLALESSAAGPYDLIMIDAFSSDSIPAHLVSREALQVYVSKLKPEGLLLFHVSNRYLKVQELVSSLLTGAGFSAFARNDDDERPSGKTGSDYVVAARRSEHLGMLPAREDWYPLDSENGVTPWTDDYSNLLGIIRWR